MVSFSFKLERNEEEKIRKIKMKIEEIKNDRVRQVMGKEKQRIIKYIYDEPGPGEYTLNYNSIEPNGPMYSIAGKLDKENKRTEDPGKLFTLEQSVVALSKSISSAVSPPPNFNNIYPNVPGMKFTKAGRFQKIEKEIDLNKSYEEAHWDHIEQRPLMGKSQRFLNLNKDDYPGPGDYKIDTFAERLVKKNERIQQLKEKTILLKKSENDGSPKRNESYSILETDKILS